MQHLLKGNILFVGQRGHQRADYRGIINRWNAFQEDQLQYDHNDVPVNIHILSPFSLFELGVEKSQPGVLRFHRTGFWICG
jgi:hypothetical protein